ncbi:MAG: hypothetical protein ACKO28_04505 [Cyanobium sp.]
MFCLSYATLALKARLAGFDWTLELAAQDLGAPPLAAFRRVTLPLYLAGAFQREIAPQIQVLSTLVLVVSAGLLALGLRRPSSR